MNEKNIKRFTGKVGGLHNPPLKLENKGLSLLHSILFSFHVIFYFIFLGYNNNKNPFIFPSCECYGLFCLSHSVLVCLER